MPSRRWSASYGDFFSVKRCHFCASLAPQPPKIRGLCNATAGPRSMGKALSFFVALTRLNIVFHGIGREQTISRCSKSAINWWRSSDTPVLFSAYIWIDTSLNRWQGESFVKISSIQLHRESQSDTWGVPPGWDCWSGFLQWAFWEKQLTANTGESVWGGL